jgi:hypothetical protein
MKIPRDLAGRDLADVLCPTGNIVKSIRAEATSSWRLNSHHTKGLPFQHIGF